MSQWYRVYFRNRTERIVQGDEALRAMIAKKVPKAIHWEETPEYQCETCGVRSAWPHPKTAWADVASDWRWFGRYIDIDAGEIDRIRIFCSQGCEPAGIERHGLDRPEGTSHDQWPSIHIFEPRFRENWRILDAAQKAADPRAFPFPIHPENRQGAGWCRWCGDRIIEHKGKRAGNQSKRRTWHRIEHGDDSDCYCEYLLHTDRDTQIWHLIERDGIGCAIDGKGEGRWIGGWASDNVCLIRWSEKLEVDHIVPLWEVLDLPPDERRIFFGPDNLWLLGERAHKAKTALEATRRAAERA